MIILKFIGGVILITGGVLLFLYENRSKKKDDITDFVGRSITFQGYILSIILLITGLGLIIFCYD